MKKQVRPVYSPKDNYRMSTKKSQGILKCFIDIKCSVWFTLGAEDETTFCDI